MENETDIPENIPFFMQEMGVELLRYASGGNRGYELSKALFNLVATIKAAPSSMTGADLKQLILTGADGLRREEQDRWQDRCSYSSLEKNIVDAALRVRAEQSAPDNAARGRESQRVDGLHRDIKTLVDFWNRGRG